MLSARTSLAGALAASLLLAGCADYLANRDSVTLGVGNAVEANVAIHTIDPFPREAWNIDIDGDGRVVARAQRRYVGGTVPAAGVSTSTTTTAAPVSAAAN